jgi:hypothetical protein
MTDHEFIHLLEAFAFGGGVAFIVMFIAFIVSMLTYACSFREPRLWPWLAVAALSGVGATIWSALS